LQDQSVGGYDWWGIQLECHRVDRTHSAPSHFWLTYLTTSIC